MVVMSHIERHKTLMRNEVRLEHIREEHEARVRSFEHFERTEKHHRQQEYNAIRADISPTCYNSKLDWILGRAYEGTGNWLLRHDTFVNWLDTANHSTKIFWLQGIPGAGKPTHICSIWSNLKGS